MNKIIKSLALVISFMPLLAMAAPKIVLDVKAEIEVTVEEGGKMVTKRIPATEVGPDTEVFYTLNYKNEGDSTATNIELKNKIPENTLYLLDSAWGENADVQFSIDDGKSFKKPSLLVYEVKGEDGKIVKKTVTPEKYTDVLWVVKEIPNGKAGNVGFKVKVN